MPNISTLNLKNLLHQLEDNIPKQELINPAVSASSIGWHIEHALLTLDQIIEAIKRSDPKKYKWKFSFPKLLVYSINRILRGRAKAPGSVQPKNDITIDTLKDHLGITREKVEGLNELEAYKHFEHPFFGKLKLRPAIKFLEIHTRHHLAIIKDILKG
jgi:hypothetical protein